MSYPTPRSSSIVHGEYLSLCPTTHLWSRSVPSRYSGTILSSSFVDVSYLSSFPGPSFRQVGPNRISVHSEGWYPFPTYSWRTLGVKTVPGNVRTVSSRGHWGSPKVWLCLSNDLRPVSTSIPVDLGVLGTPGLVEPRSTVSVWLFPPVERAYGDLIPDVGATTPRLTGVRGERSSSVRFGWPDPAGASVGWGWTRESGQSER